MTDDVLSLMRSSSLPSPLHPPNLTSSTTPSPYSASSSADHLLGFLYLGCLMFGVPANLTALSYFLLQSRDLSTCLYLVITLVDTLTCSSSSIIAVNMFTDRAPFLFQYQWFCTGWRMLFKCLQRLSVFLVLILSISRAIVLVAPLHPVSKRGVLLTVSGYLVYLVIETAVLERMEVIIYARDDVYCYEQADTRLISVINDSLHIVSLALPLIPIVCSCIISVHHVRSAAHHGSACHNDVLRRRATVTVILLTTTYLLFNIPLIANLVIWILTINHYGGWPGPVYGTSTFMYMYCWNITDVLFVGLNATCNPVIYFLRFPSCKRWCVSKLRRVCRSTLVGSTGPSNTASSHKSWGLMKQYMISPERRVTLGGRTRPPLVAAKSRTTSYCYGLNGANGERLSRLAKHQAKVVSTNKLQTIRSTNKLQTIRSTNRLQTISNKLQTIKSSNDIQLEQF